MISAFVVRCLDSIIPLLAIAEISRPNLVSVAEQAGLCLNWSQTLKTGLLVTWLLYGPLHDKPTKWHVHPAKTQISLGWSESSLGAHHFAGFVMHRLIIMYNKLPLAVRHLDGQRPIYMCTDPDSTVNGMWFISTSQSIELSECYAPVICNNGPYGAREQWCYWLFSLQSPGICKKALQKGLFKSWHPNVKLPWPSGHENQKPPPPPPPCPWFHSTVGTILKVKHGT